MTEVKTDEDIAEYEEDYEQDDYGEDGGEYENGDDLKEDPEAMKRRVDEMEEELNKLTKMQEQTGRQIHSALTSLDEKSMLVLLFYLSSTVTLSFKLHQLI